LTTATTIIMVSSTALYASTGILGVGVAGAAAIHAASPSGNKSEFMREDIVPKKRPAKFKFDDVDIKNWHEWGHFVTTFFNALSLFFPIGEAMFVRAVQQHKVAAKVNDDPVLKKQVAAFVGQEAIHGREHDRYNEEIKRAYKFSGWFEKNVIATVVSGVEGAGKAVALSATCALEHWTALLGGALLDCPNMYKKADPRMGLIWHWHACEETEHKAVAYDVFMRAYPYGFNSWILKTIGQFIATFLLWSLVFVVFVGMVIEDGTWYNLKEWYTLMIFLWGFKYDGGKTGLVRLCSLPWFDYFSPSFHPWQPGHDNAERLKEMPGLEEKIKELMEENDEETEDYDKRVDSDSEKDGKKKDHEQKGKKGESHEKSNEGDKIDKSEGEKGEN